MQNRKAILVNHLDILESRINIVKKLLATPGSFNDSVLGEPNLSKAADNVKIALKAAQEATADGESLPNDLMIRTEKLLKEGKELELSAQKIVLEMITSINNVTGLVTQSVIASSKGASTTDIFSKLDNEYKKFQKYLPESEVKNTSNNDADVDMVKFVEMFNSMQFMNRELIKKVPGLAPSMPLAIITPSVRNDNADTNSSSNSKFAPNKS